MHIVATVATVWLPLAAELTPENVVDREAAPELLCRIPAEVRFVLGDKYYNDPELCELCEEEGRSLVTTQTGRYPPADDRVEVRRMFHNLRSTAIENFNEQFKGISDGHGQVPTKRVVNTRRFALGAILVYQLTLWYRYDHGMDLRVGVRPFLKAA